MSEQSYDIPNIYVVLGMCHSTVVDTLLLEGYNLNDAYYYIFEKYQEFETNHKFIYDVVLNLINIYKKQFKCEPNLSNLKNLFDTSNEFNQNFIKIIECEQKNSINVCSYYQNNKKTIQLKPINKKVETLTSEQLKQSVNEITTNQSTTVVTKPKIAIKMKK